MNNCPNCGNHIGCSCTGGSQLVQASNGVTVCTNCITVYEYNLPKNVTQ